MIDIYVPIYNEKDGIAAFLDELKGKVHSQFQVLIVYDSKDDNTLPVLEKIKDQYAFPILMYQNRFGSGVLAAFKTGIAVSESEYFLCAMADMADDMNIVDKMKEKLDAGFDIVVGSRYMKGGARHGNERLKAFLSHTAGSVMHVLTGIPTHDISNACRMYRRKVLTSIPIITQTGHGGTIEILQKAYLQGYRITEVPDVWTDRTTGESHFKMGAWIPKCLYWCFYTTIRSCFGLKLRNTRPEMER